MCMSSGEQTCCGQQTCSPHRTAIQNTPPTSQLFCCVHHRLSLLGQQHPKACTAHAPSPQLQLGCPRLSCTAVLAAGSTVRKPSLPRLQHHRSPLSLQTTSFCPLKASTTWPCALQRVSKHSALPSLGVHVLPSFEQGAAVSPPVASATTQRELGPSTPPSFCIVSL